MVITLEERLRFYNISDCCTWYKVKQQFVQDWKDRISGPDGDQISSVEKSSFHTDDEKDTGREIAILYPTAALDI